MLPMETSEMYHNLGRVGRSIDYQQFEHALDSICEVDEDAVGNHGQLAYLRFDQTRPQQPLPSFFCDSGADDGTSKACTNLDNSHARRLLCRTECALILQGLFVEKAFPEDPKKYVAYRFMLSNVMHSKTLELAMRSFQCVIIGQIHDNPDLRQQAAVYYPQAIASLRYELFHGTIAPAHFASVVFLFLKIEMFAATSTEGGGWQQHIVGSRLAIESCKRDNTDPAISELISAISYEFGLWDGLLRKRQGVCMLDQCSDKDSKTVWSQFLCTTTQVPAVLEASERIGQLRYNATGKMVADVVGKMTALAGELHRTIRCCYSQIDGLPYWIARDRTFATSLGFKEGDAYPQNVYNFPSPHLAQTHTRYWMCLLSLHQAHLDVLNQVTKSQYSLKTPELRTRIRRDAGECADQLVMSMAYLMKHEKTYCILTKAIAPLQLAYLWYRRCNDTPLMLYCQRVAERIQSFGLNCSWVEW